MSNDEVIFVTGRDFGRLEGKVDAIASDVTDIKGEYGSLNSRVTKIESGYEMIQRERENKRKAEGEKLQKTEVKQMSRQTIIMVLGLISAVAVAAFTIGGMVHL